MNWDIRDREPITRTRIVPLTPAQEAAVHEQLAAAEARAVGLRARHAEITARLEGRKTALVAARYELAKAKAARKQKILSKIKPLEDLPMFKKDAA